MSFEVARRIVQSYRQSNEERIKSSMEMAYREALQTYKSEQAARDVALKVLQSDQKLLDTMLKNIEKSRQQMITGDMKIAKENLNREHRNAKAQAKYAHNVIIEDIKREEGRQQTLYNQARSDVDVAKAQAVVGEGFDKDMTKAQDDAGKVVLSHDIFKNNLGTAVGDLATVLESKPGNENAIANIITQQGGLASSINNYISEAKRTGNGISTPNTKDATRDKLMPYRKADTAHQIMNDLRQMVPKAKTEDLQLIEQYLYGELPKDLDLGIKKTAGKLSEGRQFTPKQVEDVYQEQVRRYYLTKTGNKLNKGVIRRPIAPGRLDRPVMKPPLEEMLPTRDASAGRELRQIAQPVFDALRNDFEITAEEQDKIPSEAIDAYNKLKEVVIDNPLAVTREEQVLLDDLALQRQYDILQQKRRISTMNPQLASTERIKARAGDLAEPEQKFDASQFSPAQQKYFATERKAYELSDKSDNDIRNIGVAEKFGLSLFNETFDKGRKSYVDGQSYDSVLSRLETQFEGKPEEQLRALAAYNSRAMALQRASNPLIVGGQKNPDYLEALKALGK